MSNANEKAKKILDQAKNDSVDYEFTKPTEVNGEKVKEVTVRKPKAGELRGLSLLRVSEADTDSMLVLIPRISKLTATDMENLPLGDLMGLATVVLAFLG